MGRYRLNRISICNFKILKQEKVFDFKNADLVVFDGPNGFGKTTVFDAIEFAMTGRIKRIDIYDKTVKNKLTLSGFPFINDFEEEFYIKLELVSDSKKIGISRYIPKAELKHQAKGAMNWSLGKLCTLNSLEQKFDTGEELSQDKFESLMGLKNLDRVFNVFFYVQQEENTFFLKHTEKDRKEHLNILFDVENESNRLGLLKKVHTVVRDRHKKIKAEIDELKTENEKQSEIKEPKKTQYEKLFEGVEVDWDEKKFDLNNYQITDLEEKINTVIKFSENFDDFIDHRNALKIKNYLSNPRVVESLLIKSSFEKKYNEITSNFKTSQKLSELLSFLKTENIFVEENWDLYKGLITDLKFDFIKSMEKIKNLIDLKKLSSELNQSTLDFKEARTDFIDIHKKHKALDSNIDEKNCPLCGQNWDTYEDLAKQFEKHAKTFKKIDDALLVAAKTDFDNFVVKLRSSAVTYETNTFFVPEQIVGIVNGMPRVENLFEDIKEYSKVNNIEIKKAYAFETLDSLKLFSEKAKQLSDLITEKITEQAKLLDEEYNGFADCFLKYFGSDESLVPSLDKKQLEDKKKYLSSLYANHFKGQKIERDNKIKNLNEFATKIKGKMDNIKDVQKIYEESIKRHISQIVSDISIPFYVYSGRILQEFFGGNGIFVKMGSGKSEGVKFFSEVDRKNDPLYTLSSGQISALVLSFCLTLNEVYNEHSFGSIFIDDPIQTMDEINTITFIDLLKTSFSNRQIFISTHEEKFSALLRYKFNQTGADIKRISMKDYI